MRIGMTRYLGFFKPSDDRLKLCYCREWQSLRLVDPP